jgi:pimeloyl-ACP methyl ester carboxylesterase
MDVRDALASVRVPTLVLHREGYTPVALEHGRYLAEHIPGARFAVVPGATACYSRSRSRRACATSGSS